jgi:hypothetical protein
MSTYRWSELDWATIARAATDEGVPAAQKLVDAALARAHNVGMEEAAKWHDVMAIAAMSGLHAGSNNEEYRECHRIADWHTNAAAAIRAAKEKKP